MQKILVIGAQNIDLFAHAKSDYTLHDSNISKIHMAFGGVGCNIATNLVLLGNKVDFLTVFASDHFGHLAKKNLVDLEINIEESLEVKNVGSSIYLGVMDKDNDLFLGLNDMEIIDNLNIDFFKKKANYIMGFEYIVIDNNLRPTALEYLLRTYKDKHIIMDAVSAEKAIKLKGLLPYISLLKVNLLELKALSDKPTIELKIDDLLSRGLSQILLTNSSKEIVFKSDKEHCKTRPIPVKEIKSASGAGDAFLAGFIYGKLNQKLLEDCLEIAKRTAFQTLQSTNSTNNNHTLSL